MNNELSYFCEKNGITEEMLDDVLCRCEDFPCCGHDREDRWTTWRDLFNAQKRNMKMIQEEMW